jgi:hypothetical protein
VTVRKNGCGLSSARAGKKAEGGSGLRGNGVGVARGGARPFLGAGGAPRRW